MTKYNVIISAAAHIGTAGPYGGLEELKNLFVEKDKLEVNEWGIRVQVRKADESGTYEILLPWHSVAGLIEITEE